MAGTAGMVQSARTMASEAFEMTDWRHYIVADPAVLAGKPVVRDTRLAVDFILGLFASGWTEDQVLQNHPNVSRDALRAVFAFAAESVGAETIDPKK